MAQYTRESALQAVQLRKQRQLEREQAAQAAVLFPVELDLVLDKPTDTGLNLIENRFKTYLHNEILAQAELLVKVKPKSVSELSKWRTRVCADLISAGSKLFGWDQKQTTHNHLDFYVGARLKPKQSAPVIDVEPAQDKP